MSNTPQEALKKIQQAAKNKASILNLRSLKLKEIPPELILLKDHLKELYLNNNNIEEIQSLEELINLSKLYLQNNNIEEIQNLDELNNLSTLYLHNNKIEKIQNLDKLNKLSKLSLHNNKIEKIINLDKLNKLSILYLGNNNIEKIQNLETLNKLSELYLHNNNIEKIQNLEELYELSKLSLYNNKIKDIKSLFFLLENNWKIDLTKKYSFELKTKEIGLHNNPLNNELVTAIEQGNEAIFRYYQQLELGKAYIREIKIVLVGDAEQGKTSLLRRLEDINQKLPEAEDRTLGIEISQLPLWKDGEEIIGHFWDFGGQVLFDASHRLFYSDDCLYILVTSNAKQKKDATIKNWITNIEMYGGQSPIQIVNNEFFDFTDVLYDIGEFKKDECYNIREEFALNLKKLEEKDTEELAKLKEAITYEVQKLPILKNPVPKNWKLVRDCIIVLKEKQAFLSFTDLHQMINDILPNRLDVEDLCIQFHKRGFLLWYKGIPHLEDKVFINPDWAIKAINYLLKDMRLKSKQGMFTRSMAQEIWQEIDDSYTEMTDTLIELMKAFRLAFPKGNTAHTYIIPSRLSNQQPQALLDWEPTEKVKLVYEYPYLPKGMVNQLTCLLYDKLKDHESVWNGGFMLVYQSACALIKEEEDKLTITVEGKNRQPLIAIIQDKINLTHQMYKGIREKQHYEVFIQCPYDICLTKKEPQTFKYKNLMEWYQENPTRDVTCNASQKSFPILKVFNEIGIEVPLNLGKRLERESPPPHLPTQSNSPNPTLPNPKWHQAWWLKTAGAFISSLSIFYYLLFHYLPNFKFPIWASLLLAGVIAYLVHISNPKNIYRNYAALFATAALTPSLFSFIQFQYKKTTKIETFQFQLGGQEIALTTVFVAAALVCLGFHFLNNRKN